jgi:hypothetical protein
MNYYVDIIDTENNDYTTRVEMAAASSVVLSYKGSDQKDDLKIVGSSLKFTILVPGVENVDGALDHCPITFQIDLFSGKNRPKRDYFCN